MSYLVPVFIAFFLAGMIVGFAVVYFGLKFMDRSGRY